MRDEQDGLRSANPPAITRDQTLILRLVAHHLHIALRKTGGDQPLRHRLRRLARVTRGVAGVDLDQLPENVALEFSHGVALRQERDGREKDGEAGSEE